MVEFYKKSSFIEKLVYLYILSLPIDGGNALILFNKKLQYSDLFFLILFIFWFIYRLKYCIKGSKRLVSSIYIFIAFFLVATLPSFINSINLRHSLVEWLGLLYLALLFLIISDTVDTFEKFRKLLFVYSFSAVISASVGLGAFLNYLITHRLAGNPFLFTCASESSLLFFPRIKSFFYTTNMFVSFEHIGLVTSICLLFLSIGNTVKRNILLVSIGLIMMSILLAGSQCLAGVLLTFFIISLQFRSRIMRILKYIVFICTSLVIVFAFCATVWMIYPVKLDNDIQGKTINLSINYAYSHHLIPSIYAFSMFQGHPLFGVGIGTFTDQYPRYINMDIEKLSSARLQVDPYRVLDPHNTYTGALAERGLLGFFAMFVLFLQFIKMLTRDISLTENTLFNPVYFSLLAGFIGFIFNGLFIDIMMMRHLWVFMAIIFTSTKRIQIPLIDGSKLKLYDKPKM